MESTFSSNSWQDSEQAQIPKGPPIPLNVTLEKKDVVGICTKRIRLSDQTIYRFISESPDRKLFI